MIDSNRFIHCLKTAIALFIGIIIVRAFNMPVQGRWILISVLLVMCAQSRIGALMQKSYMRFLGSLMGACIAALTLYLAYPSVIWTTLALCFTAALFSYIADSPSYLSEASSVGAITVLIIMTSQPPSYAIAIDRCFEISLGILLAFLVSRFMFPLRSRTYLRRSLISTLIELKTLSEQLRVWNSAKAEKAYIAYDEKVITHLVMQNQLYREVRRESFDRADLARIFSDILAGEREIFRYLNLMQQALSLFSEEVGACINEQALVQSIYEMSQRTFTSIINQVETEQHSNLIEFLDNFSDWGNKMRQQLEPLTKNASDKFAVDLFIFAAGRLLARLHKMHPLINKV